MAWPKTDSRPKCRRWAPGSYAGCCHWCGQKFLGDKLATECADCAHTEPHPSETGARALGAERMRAAWQKYIVQKR